MDVTGLKPSDGKRFYPKSDWHNRPPGVDHIHGWYDPATKTYLFTDERYGVGDETQAERVIWCERHGYGVIRSRWASIYGYGTDLYMSATRGTALDVRAMITKLEDSALPISDRDWAQHAKA